MALYGTFRFINEWLRASDSTSPFHIGHIWSIVSLIVGATLIIVIKFKTKKGALNNETN